MYILTYILHINIPIYSRNFSPCFLIYYYYYFFCQNFHQMSQVKKGLHDFFLLKGVIVPQAKREGKTG
jgi:hypothetical protein